jgi:hypothetical protein
MSSQLPRPSASAGTASGRALSCGKLAIATQRQRERAKLLAHVDKSREPTIDKTRAFTRAGPATPSSVERAHRLLQRSAMKQPPDVPLCARTMSPVLELLAMIPKIPTTVERVACPVLELPATIPELPPPVERVSGEQHVGGDQNTAPSTERVVCPVLELPATIPKLPPPVERVLGEQHVGGDQDTAPSTPPSKQHAGGDQDMAPSTPPSKATPEKALDDYNDP